MKTYRVFFVLAGLLFAAGCAGQKQFSGTDRICIPAVTKAKAFSASEKALAKLRFTIDKSDSEQGLIRTNPLRGSQFFEFWRGDSVGAFNASESNLSTIQRTAELNINQEDSQVCINCCVKTQRLSLPDRDVTSASHKSGIYSRNPAGKPFRFKDGQTASWIELGRDARLETKILKRIEKQLKQ